MIIMIQRPVIILLPAIIILRRQALEQTQYPKKRESVAQPLVAEGKQSEIESTVNVEFNRVVQMVLVGWLVGSMVGSLVVLKLKFYCPIIIYN